MAGQGLEAFPKVTPVVGMTALTAATRERVDRSWYPPPPPPPPPTPICTSSVHMCTVTWKLMPALLHMPSVGGSL